MGFSSFDCKRCKHPLLSKDATSPTNAWMIDGMAVMPDSSIVEGKYDGYGRLGGSSIVVDGVWTGAAYEPPVDGKEPSTPDAYHAVCWALAGKPSTWKGGSKWSKDQGWFFDHFRVHQMPNPMFKSAKAVRSIPAKKPTSKKAWEEAFDRMTKEDPVIGGLWSQATKIQNKMFRLHDKGSVLIRRYSKREEASAVFKEAAEVEAEVTSLLAKVSVEAESALGPYRWGQFHRFKARF